MSFHSTAINGQRIVNERRIPYRSFKWWAGDRQSRPFDHFFVAHSNLKTDTGGHMASTTAMDYYDKQSAERKAELLAKYGKA